MAILHALTALLLARVAWLARGPRAATLAMALAAFAPWDVLYGDRIWGSCVVPVWGALAIYGSARAREQPRWLGAVVFLALVLPQMHLSSPILWAACAVIVALRRPARWPWRALGVGLGLVVLAYLPTLLAEFRSDFANTHRILNRAGGNAPWSEALWAPVKVFAYAVLYGSSEIGYHWARGYWGGGFSEAEAYLTARGLGRWLHQHGPGLAAAHAVSVALAAVGWGVGLRSTVRAIVGQTRHGTSVGQSRAGTSVDRNRPSLDLETVLTLGLLAGLTVGAVLMVVARKRYFPHYANILMPMVLAPMVFGLDRLAARSWARLGVSAAVAVSMLAMLIGTARYYLTIDALNGLGPTLAMVDRVAEDSAAAQVRFTHFNNGYAWQVLARGVHGRSLSGGPTAVQYTVHNARPHQGAAPHRRHGTRPGPAAASASVQRPRTAGQPAVAIDSGHRHSSPRSDAKLYLDGRCVPLRAPAVAKTRTHGAHRRGSASTAAVHASDSRRRGRGEDPRARRRSSGRA